MLKSLFVATLPWLVLFSGVLGAQERNFVLHSVDVYGTEKFDGATVSQEFAAEIEQALTALADEDHARLDEIQAQIEERLESRGPFAYLRMGGVFGFTPPNFEVNVTIDVVEEADRDRRMPFRAPPTGEYSFPDGLLTLWEEYGDKAFELAMAGEALPASECPVLHCVSSFDHPDLKPYLPLFNEGVRRHEDLLYEIADGDGVGSHRVTAILLLAHTNNADRLLPALGRAIYDPGQGVRNYAMRIMSAMAEVEPARDYPVHDLVTALDFPDVTDRNKAAYTLLPLTASPQHREIILSEALPTLLLLLRRGPLINHQPAYEILKELSGEDFGPRNYSAWEDWASSEL